MLIEIIAYFQILEVKMLIFGHKLIKSFEFQMLKDVFLKDKINCFCYDENHIRTAKELEVDFAIFAQNEDELILSNALGAKFILIEDENLAKIASKMAEFYLFDTKIIYLVNELKNLNTAYHLGVDGVILRKAIKDL